MSIISIPARVPAYAVGESMTVGYPTTTHVQRSPVTVANCVTSRTSNPNYRVQIAKQQDAGTYYERQGIDFSLATIDCSAAMKRYFNYPVESRHVNGVDFGNLGLDFVPIDDAALADIALGRIKNRLASELGTYKALCPVAEIGEMRGLIRSAAELTTVAVKTLIDIKSLRSPRTAFKYAADAWLTYNFGIAPTLRDIQGISSAIDQYVNRADHKVAAFGAASRDWFSSRSIGPYFPEPQCGNFMKLTNQARFEHSLSYKFKAAYAVQMNSANNYGALAQLGFTLEDLPSAVWQFGAFTWVADYFGTVGNYLSDVFSSPAGSTIYISKSRLYTCRYSGNLTWKAIDPIYVGYPISLAGSSAGTPTAVYWAYRRDKLAVLPHRSLRFKTQDEVGSFAVSKLLNLASILLK